MAGESAEVWEVEITSDVGATQAPLRDLTLHGCLVAAIERAGVVRVPGADDRLAAGDTVVLLVHDQHSEQIQDLFIKPKG